jgi:prophage DNA circulation protein
MTPGERRAYRLGFLRAMRKARKELHEMTQRWDDELRRVDDEMRTARERVAQSIDDELDGVRAEMEGMRNEYRRLRAIEHAIDVEYDPDMPLN